MKFTIDPEHLCSVTIHTDYMKDRPEDEQLIAKLKGHKFCSTHSEDHPEFAKLRNQLEDEGYIETQSSWWNGDRVLKDFSLNGAIFKKGEKFCSGAAIKWDVDRKIEEQTKRKARLTAKHKRNKLEAC
jgi:hypothetical protein